MPVFGRGRATLPRLVPELDDTALARVRRQLDSLWALGQQDIAVSLVESLIRDAGQDWDRKGHRLKVLAHTAGDALPDFWRRHRPQRQDALLLQAWADIARASQQSAAPDLRETQRLCLRAADLLPEDPTPWTLLLAAQRRERRPLREVGAVWREIKSRDAWHREAHLEVLAYLSPDECGSATQVRELVDGACAVMPRGAPTAALELTAFVRAYQRDAAAGGLVSVSAHKHWSRPDAARALDRAVAQWPTPGFLTHAAALADLNVLAYALIKAVRMDEAGTALRAIGGVATAWPWSEEGDPLRRFAYWYDGLTAGAGGGRRPGGGRGRGRG
ncbi:hypothetical protein AB0M29_00085 [Streptomyces sp. NPDC051976]|uniref:hypothetical protein n=1 Tax=Streptomyces sp. NPDC051976 TaxID=3154947 RepID=UPI00341C7A54